MCILHDTLLTENWWLYDKMKKLIVPTVKLYETLHFIWVQALTLSQRENMPLLGKEFWRHCWMALVAVKLEIPSLRVCSPVPNRAKF